MKKINVGAGGEWQSDGWDVLDNGPSNYGEPWKFRGKCWETNLPSEKYDILFCSHMLEHVPHFRLEKTIAELNRIMKIGGTIRILVPRWCPAQIASMYHLSPVTLYMLHPTSKTLLVIRGNVFRNI